MSALVPFVLPPDVIIQPVARLSRELREQVAHQPGDYSVTRPNSRTMSSIIDATTAALLESFRTPCTIVDAVIAFSSAADLDPRGILDDAFTVLRDFVDQGFLVAAGTELARPIAASLTPGHHVSGFEIVEPAYVIADTEVYRACASDGSAAALKISRPAADRRVLAAFGHEAAILARLDGRVNPRLLESGEHEGRPFLAVSWCAGVDVEAAADEARRLGDPARRHALLRLAEDVIEAYAHLHAQGVLHGDVQPHNVLVGAAGAITIIDFGLAAMPDAAATAGTPAMVSAGGRGGIDFFLEPELAAAWLAGGPPPALSAAGEQYSLGALIYLMLTGAHTHAFSLQQEEMLHQLCEQPPLPFSRHSAPAMPSVESTVARALAKSPDARYRSVADLLRSFRAAAHRDSKLGRTVGRPARAQGLLDDVLGRLAVPGNGFAAALPAPTSPVMNGAAGIAYALLRIAKNRSDERLLATADVWSTSAALSVGSPDAFSNAELQIVPETIGSNSFYHHASGLYCVQSLIAHARGDDLAQRLALESFLAAAAQPCEYIDIAFGQAGLLLGCSLALDAPPPAPLQQSLLALGTRLHDNLWSQLSRQPALVEGSELRPLGVAHGWAGCLFALLRWSQASSTPPPAGLSDRLDQLANLGQPAGRGLRWPHEAGAPVSDGALEASWCNGAAGYVHLWTLAHNQLGEEGYARYAQMAAWAVSQEGPALSDLCCGLAGRAYALLSLYRHSGDTTWLARAHRLADQAATGIRIKPLRRDSLYKGEVGVALLMADLQMPEQARMPLFEAEE